MGIDVGNTALVIQYNSPRDASRMSQRLGRSGHRIKETAIGRIVSTEATQILESAGFGTSDSLMSLKYSEPNGSNLRAL